MKNRLYIIIGVLCGLFAACDNIAEDDRLIYEKPPVVSRAVLIEDFTGQRCVNCPMAADEIHRLQEEYGEDAVIAVGIHGGPMAVMPNPARPNVIGLATETGDNYNTYWKIEQWPMGMVNRGTVSPYSDWGSLVRTELQKTAPVDITVSPVVLPPGSASLIVNVEGHDGNVAGKLQVWIIEDDITATQLMPDGTANQAYVHQHVFRAAVNGEWGEDISVKEGESVSKYYDVALQDDWNFYNLSAVAFVYNDQGVLQVVRQELDVPVID